MPQNRLPKCLKPKEKTLSLKKQCSKKTYEFIWKKSTEPSSKMPETKKTNTLIEKTILFQKNVKIHMKKCHKTTLSLKKNILFQKKLINSYETRPRNRLPKCLKPKKQTLSSKKQFCSKIAYKFIWKKATEPSSKMPEAKKTNTLIEKTILFQKKLINSYDKNATEPSSKMPEAKKTNTLIEKTILLQKSLSKEV